MVKLSVHKAAQRVLLEGFGAGWQRPTFDWQDAAVAQKKPNIVGMLQMKMARAFESVRHLCFYDKKHPQKTVFF